MNTPTRIPKPPTQAQLKKLIDDWNQKHPIGTPVTRYKLINPLREGNETKTRSEAWIMGGHSAMVMVEGVAGGVVLESVVPLIVETAVYEIFNPSDPYTIKGPFLPCAVAVALLGKGAYGIQDTPMLFGWTGWFIEQGIPDVNAYVEDHKADLISVLDTVLIGTEGDRKEAEATLATLPQEKWEEWLAQRHDKIRTSMTDIGANAKRLAEALRLGVTQQAQS